MLFFIGEIHAFAGCGVPLSRFSAWFVHFPNCCRARLGPNEAGAKARRARSKTPQKRRERRMEGPWKGQSTWLALAWGWKRFLYHQKLRIRGWFQMFELRLELWKSELVWWGLFACEIIQILDHPCWNERWLGDLSWAGMILNGLHHKVDLGRQCVDAKDWRPSQWIEKVKLFRKSSEHWILRSNSKAFSGFESRRHRAATTPKAPKTELHGKLVK